MSASLPVAVLVGYEGRYQISTKGRVKSLGILKSRNGIMQSYKTPKAILKPLNHTHGYLKITIYKDGRGRQFYIHRLVAEAFVPNPNELPQVNHKDTNKHNNKTSNLEWVTSQQNHDHAKANGISRKGSKNVGATTNEKTVGLIRKEYATGTIKIFQLALKYKLSYYTTYFIVRKKTWNHVQ